MNTIVDFEIGKLLKERGYNEPHNKVYNTLGELWDSHYPTMTNDDVDSGACCTAPIIAEVVMWLYEKYGVWVEVNLLPNIDKFSFIAKPINFKKPKEFDSYVEYYKAVSKFISKERFNLPTEAYFEAIKYTLNNLV